MNRLTRDKRAEILGMMVEGVSLRAISRLTGASKNTIVKLLEDAGEAFSEYQDRTCATCPASAYRSTKSGASSTQGEERRDSQGRSAAGWRYLDVDGDRRGYQAGPVLVGRRP